MKVKVEMARFIAIEATVGRLLKNIIKAKLRSGQKYIRRSYLGSYSKCRKTTLAALSEEFLLEPQCQSSLHLYSVSLKCFLRQLVTLL